MTDEPPDLQHALAVAIEAAKDAAAIVRGGWQRLDSIAVDAKGRGDVVTDVDRAAERAVIARLHAAFPEHGFLGEESGAATHSASEHRWIIDPLDGTMNFVRGVPHFCTSIALARGSTTLVAVVLDPLRDELFHAVRGIGAWLAGRRLHVSPCTDLGLALLATVFPKPGSKFGPRYRPGLIAALDAAAGLRRSGSMVLDLAYVAAGRFDGFWEFGMQPWDIAAGALLVTEASGAVAAIDGEADVMAAQGIVAGTPAIMPALRALCGDDPDRQRA